MLGSEATEFRVPSGKSNGLTCDKQGSLLACEGASRPISRIEAYGTVVALAPHYNGPRLKSPNDVVVKSNGSVHFTDSTFGLSVTYGVEEAKERSFQGIYRIPRMVE